MQKSQCFIPATISSTAVFSSWARCWNVISVKWFCLQSRQVYEHCYTRHDDSQGSSRHTEHCYTRHDDSQGSSRLTGCPYLWAGVNQWPCTSCHMTWWLTGELKTYRLPIHPILSQYLWAGVNQWPCTSCHMTWWLTGELKTYRLPIHLILSQYLWAGVNQWPCTSCHMTCSVFYI